MRGYTLLELSAALLLVAIAWTTLVRPLRSFGDRAAVLGARESLVGLLQETRTTALMHGGASLHLESSDSRAWITVGDSTIRVLGVGDAGRVRIVLGGGRTLTEIPYNALGLGVFANETVELRAGSARAAFVVSAHGRIRRE
jgi:prepilin-type N-terminal cleavage/methylation domain-containing protein